MTEAVERTDIPTPRLPVAVESSLRMSFGGENRERVRGIADEFVGDLADATLSRETAGAIFVSVVDYLRTAHDRIVPLEEIKGRSEMLGQWFANNQTPNVPDAPVVSLEDIRLLDAIPDTLVEQLRRGDPNTYPTREEVYYELAEPIRTLRAELRRFFDKEDELVEPVMTDPLGGKIATFRGVQNNDRTRDKADGDGDGDGGGDDPRPPDKLPAPEQTRETVHIGDVVRNVSDTSTDYVITEGPDGGGMYKIRNRKTQETRYVELNDKFQQSQITEVGTIPRDLFRNTHDRLGALSENRSEWAFEMGVEEFGIALAQEGVTFKTRFGNFAVQAMEYDRNQADSGNDIRVAFDYSNPHNQHSDLHPGPAYTIATARSGEFTYSGHPQGFTQPGSSVVHPTYLALGEQMRQQVTQQLPPGWEVASFYRTDHIRKADYSTLVRPRIGIEVRRKQATPEGSPPEPPVDPEVAELEQFAGWLEHSYTSIYASGPEGKQNYIRIANQGHELGEVAPWENYQTSRFAQLSKQPDASYRDIVIEAVQYGPAKDAILVGDRTMETRGIFTKKPRRFLNKQVEVIKPKRVLRDRKSLPGFEQTTISYIFKPALANKEQPYDLPEYDTGFEPGEDAGLELDWTVPSVVAEEIIAACKEDREKMRRFVEYTARQELPRAYSVGLREFEDWWKRVTDKGRTYGIRPPWEKWPAELMHFFEEVPVNLDGNPNENAIDRSPKDKPDDEYTFDQTHRHWPPSRAA